MALVPMPATITSAASSAAVRALGQAGEVNGLRLFSRWLGIGVSKNATSLSGLRPDVLLRDAGVLGEIKNVQYQALTRQLRGYLGIATELKLDPVLMVRWNTRLSGPLLDLESRSQLLILRRLP